MGRDAKLKAIQVESIKKLIVKTKNMIGYCAGRLNAFDAQMVKDQNQFDEVKKTYNDHVKAMQGYKAKHESYILNLEAKILDLDAKPVKQPNGKIICQYCEKEFSPQGIGSHEKACKVKFDEKAKLMARLEVLKKEELIPVVIPEVEEIPTVKEKLEIVKEVKEIINDKKAELEAELEQKEGE